MSFIAKFIPDPLMVTAEMGTPDERGYYDVEFAFLAAQEILETEPEQVVCSYSLMLNGNILNYRFQFSYAFDGSNATAETAEAELEEYLKNMYVAAGGTQ